MHIGLTYDLRSDYLAAGYGEEETAEFDQARHDRGDRRCALRAWSYDRSHRPCAKSGRAAGARRSLGSGVQHLRRSPRPGPRGAGAGDSGRVRNPVHVCRSGRDCALCLDKALTKTVLRAAGVPTPDWHVVRELADVERCQVAVSGHRQTAGRGNGQRASTRRRRSPIAARCGKFASGCSSSIEQPVLVEQFLARTRVYGRPCWARAPRPKSSARWKSCLRDAAEPDVYSYVNKEHCEELVRLIAGPSRRDDVRVAEAERIALAAWRAVGGRDAGRIDLRCDAAGKPQLMEINPLAGLHPTHSDLPMLWTETGSRVCGAD